MAAAFDSMKGGDLRHARIPLLGEGAAGSELGSLLVWWFLDVPRGWTSPDLGPSRTDSLFEHHSWLHESGPQRRLVLLSTYPLQLILFFKVHV